MVVVNRFKKIEVKLLGERSTLVIWFEGTALGYLVPGYTKLASRAWKAKYFR